MATNAGDYQWRDRGIDIREVIYWSWPRHVVPVQIKSFWSTTEEGTTRAVRILVAVLATMFALTHAAIAAEPVDALLVLASDVSRSVDDAKFKLQRDGYVAAITNPKVLDAIRSGPHGRIAICFVEWSGVASQKVVIDWTLIDGIKAAQDFASQLDEAPRSFADRTSISGGIDFAIARLERAPFRSSRRTIDVSGDGTNNSGRDVAAARDDAVAQGVTINGLVILTEPPLGWDPSHTNPPGGLEAYYRNNVIGGPNSFVMVAESFNAFSQAILNKLIAEVAATEVKQHGMAGALAGLGEDQEPVRTGCD